MTIKPFNPQKLIHALMLAVFCTPTLISPVNASALKRIPFEFYASGENLRNVLTSLATNSDAGIWISSNISEKFNGHISQQTTEKALDYLSNAYDLVWYYDFSTLYIYKSKELRSEIFQLNAIGTAELKRNLIALKVWDERYRWRSVDGSNLLMISGPPRYLEIIENTIKLLQNGYHGDNGDPLELRLFKLKNASATDRKFTARGEEIILPGVATVVANMMVSSDVKNTTMINYANSKKSASSTPETNNEHQDNIKETSLSKASGLSHPLARIQADTSLNAIIVQDYRSRIRLYENLIKKLDQPREQLEISLVIIDISSNSLEQIGVSWSTDSINAGEGLIDLILPSSGTDAKKKTSADFLATVSLLETQGQARVTSRPAVVTENGIQAMLDNNETFYVKVRGERVAKLEEITYGTLLQVTPRIVEGNSPKRIYLDINIEDGNRLKDSAVGSLPSIRNTQISTRASVPEGSSLLIGGYYRESDNRLQNNIPGLSDIPLIGSLFSHHEDSSSQVVRLFMISPKIIRLNQFEQQKALTLEQPFSFSNQIREMASLSNSAPGIVSIANLQPCEQPILARSRRNRYLKKGYKIHMQNCRNLKGSNGIRVSLTQCPEGSIEMECRL